MNLLFAVLHLEAPLLEVTVVNDVGVRRRIEIRWNTKDATQEPPADWLGMVKGELDFQEAEALARSKGRILL